MINILQMSTMHAYNQIRQRELLQKWFSIILKRSKILRILNTKSDNYLIVICKSNENINIDNVFPKS